MTITEQYAKNPPASCPCVTNLKYEECGYKGCWQDGYVRGYDDAVRLARIEGAEFVVAAVGLVKDDLLEVPMEADGGWNQCSHGFLKSLKAAQEAVALINDKK